MGRITTDNIKYFRTVNEFNSAYTGEEYIEPWVSYCVENSGVSFNKKENPLEKPLTFNIASAGVISWKEFINWEEAQETDEYFKTIEYNKNGTGWITITANTDINVVSGDIVQFRGDNDAYYYYDENEDVEYMTNFMGSTAGFTVEGNVMSLIDSTNFSSITAMTANNDYAFEFMFVMCTGLTSAENLMLPATTLTESCYAEMFFGCTSLTQAPVLPATTLASNCYGSMFGDCVALTAAPSLPATTLANYCYGSMFYNCTSLTTAPELPATSLADYCYDCMFHSCESLTTAPTLPATTLSDLCYHQMFYNCTSLTTAPALPATTLTQSCYAHMFYGCTSLTTAPSLPATTLTNWCYNNMFEGCTSLTTAPALPATTLAEGCYYGMFNGCTSLTTAPSILPATTLTKYCYDNMFKGCTSLVTAPELPAQTLVDSCYFEMFYGCSSLNYIKCLATSIPNTVFLQDWVYGVSATGTFVKSASMSSWTTGNRGIPNGWTVEDAS